MSAYGSPSGSSSTRLSAAPLRVGLMGLLGAGNIGNDACLEAVLRHLRSAHPDAVLDAMGTGPQQLKDEYGLDAVGLYWHHEKEEQASRGAAVLLKLFGKVVDTYRIPAWVRQHDVVILPGTGILEATLPLRPWETPYSVFILSLSARLFRTRVAFVDVGANFIERRMTRWLLTTAARLAFYRSYRDTLSWDAMRARGLDTTDDHIFADLAYSLPPPAKDSVDPSLVGVGVMGYHGTNDDDRRQSDQIHAAYVEKMKQFVRWLLDRDRRVRLLVGDENDRKVVDEILRDVKSSRPDRQSWVGAEPVRTFVELSEAISPARSVVATRFHNVLCALKLGKPTVSIGYSEKNARLMADAGLGAFCQSVRSLDLDLLIEQFLELEHSSAELTSHILERSISNARALDAQFAELTSVVLSAQGV